MQLSREQLLQAYRRMATIRAFEERLHDVIAEVEDNQFRAVHQTGRLVHATQYHHDGPFAQTQFSLRRARRAEAVIQIHLAQAFRGGGVRHTVARDVGADRPRPRPAGRNAR